MIKERNSNYELMRIISMFMIIIWHIIIHGGILNTCNNIQVKKILEFILMIIIIHVNSFILLTGYFQSTNKFRQSKIWSLINASLFYKVIIIIFFTIFFGLNLSNVDYIREFFIFNLDEYWFIKYYIFLYIISPFLNILINNIKKNQYQKLLLVLFFIFSILPFITGGKAFENNGYNLTNFVFLYFIGAYLRRYPMKDWYIFKKISNNLYKLILLILFVTIVILNFSLYQTNEILKDYGSVFNEVFGNMYNMALTYSNPLVIMQSIIFFSLFSTFNFNIKLINNISKLTMGIYLIHDNNYVRDRIYNFFEISIRYNSSYKFIIYMFFVAVVIFVLSGIIEFLRQKLFKFIYNLKISRSLSKKYYNFIDSCVK